MIRRSSFFAVPVFAQQELKNVLILTGMRSPTSGT
jgi:hypothetical protein